MSEEKVVNVPEIPEKSVYKVGDTITVVSDGYGFYKYDAHSTSYLVDGSQVLEVEVKSVKLARLVLE